MLGTKESIPYHAASLIKCLYKRIINYVLGLIRENNHRTPFSSLVAAAAGRRKKSAGVRLSTQGRRAGKVFRESHHGE